MSQPHFLRLGLLRQVRRLLECHMLVFSRLGFFPVLAVHAFTDKQIRILRVLRNYRKRSRIGTVCHLDSLPVTSEHHIRC